MYNPFMAVCEFSQPSMDRSKAQCRTTVALSEIIATNDLGGVFKPIDLKKDICDNCDPTARDQCPAYADLVIHGRNSSYCK